MFNIRGWRGVALPPLRPPQKRSALRTRFADCRRPPCRARRWPSSSDWGGSAVPLRRFIPPSAWPCGHPSLSRRRSWPSRKDCWNGSDPEAAGGGVRIPIRRDARTGHRNRQVAPVHGPKTRIGNRRLGGRGATSGRPATCGTGEARIVRADSVHIDPDVSCTPLVRHRWTRLSPQPAARSSNQAKLRSTVTHAAHGSAALRLSAALRYSEGCFRQRLFLGMGLHPSPGQARIRIGKNCWRINDYGFSSSSCRLRSCSWSPVSSQQRQARADALW